MANIISISIYIFINICSSSFGGEKKWEAEDAPVSVLCARHRLRQRRQSVPRRREVDIASAKHLRQIKIRWWTGGECSERLFWEAAATGLRGRPCLRWVCQSWSIKTLWLCKLCKTVRIIPWNIERNFYKYLQIKRWQCLQEECKLKEKQETKNNKMKETVVSPIVSFRKTLEYVFFFKILFLIELPGKNDTLSWILEDFLFAPVHLSRIWSWTWLLDIFTPLN